MYLMGPTEGRGGIPAPVVLVQQTVSEARQHADDIIMDPITHTQRRHPAFPGVSLLLTRSRLSVQLPQRTITIQIFVLTLLSSTFSLIPTTFLGFSIPAATYICLLLAIHAVYIYFGEHSSFDRLSFPPHICLR